MKSEALASFPLPWLTVAGLVIFFAYFTGMLIWIHRGGSGAHYRIMAEIPLTGEDDV